MAADRKVGPLEVACPTCGALTGLQCMAGGRVNPGVFHSARIKEASTRVPTGVGHREKAEQLMADILKGMPHRLAVIDSGKYSPTEKALADIEEQGFADLIREYHEELFAAVWERDPGKIS